MLESGSWKAAPKSANHKLKAHLRKIEHAERVRCYEEAEDHDAGVEAVLARIVPHLTYETRMDDIKNITLTNGTVVLIFSNR